MLKKLAPYKKAVAGFVTPGLVALGVALLPGGPGGQAITQGEALGALAAMLATCGVVLQVRNTGTRQAQKQQVTITTLSTPKLWHATSLNTRKD